MRAGMTMRTSAIAAPRPSACGKMYALPSPCRVGRYTGCQGRGKPAICAPPQSAAAASNPPTFRASLEAMDSFEVNKILGAILGTCLGVLSINIAAGAIFAPAKPAKPGYEIGAPEQAPAGKPAEPEKQESIEQLLAKADVGRGENAAKKCQACHTFAKGGRNLVGPNLWGRSEERRVGKEGSCRGARGRS